MSKIVDSFNMIVRTLRRFISLSFILALFILSVRLFELIVTSNFANYPPNSFIYLLIGFKFDIIFYLRISAILMLPYLIIGLISQKAARNFFIIISTLFILGDFLLLKYFSVARVPLGADLFGYSFGEIKHTVRSSGEVGIWFFIVVSVFLFYMIRVFIKHVYFKLKPWVIGGFVVLMFASLIPIKILNPQPASFNNEFSMFIATNKLNFFSESIIKRYVFNDKLDKKSYSFTSFTSNNDGSFNYIDPEYPFLHVENTPNVLGNYIELGKTKPNIVFIIIESLGRGYSGEGAYLGSFTPFLDSLANKSLYWENCLSTSGRTFEVLPSLLASVPFGENGFAEMGENMPDHISLISLLKKQAEYQSSFIYGSGAHFDNMDVFLNRQGVDKIIDEETFGDGYEKLPAASNGFSWGYGDKEIFRRYIAKIDNDTLPRIDVMLTMAMHDPFIIQNQQRYLSKFNNRLAELNLPEETKNFNENYEKEFSTILYFDESLKYFFAEMQKLQSFDSTIFIITGDHRMPEIPIRTQLDRFHVPLIIYSPMLTKTGKFSAMVSHFDVAPSLVALLNENKTISRPVVASWIGRGLDDEENFRNLNAFPLMRNKNEILDFIDGERMLANNAIYQIYETLEIEPIRELGKQAEIKSRLTNFMQQSFYASKNNKLIPDSLLQYTIEKK
ncbi:MAG: sulfatase-like hydrolase/transferase [Prolixibacteraceae bacterium]|nr:sulfatase-like hydrolase/transferase [Prolixibacteraceae bacterium]